jgi:ABC-type nitrate/sulfonate/bicarbonate transport system permease component
MSLTAAPPAAPVEAPGTVVGRRRDDRRRRRLVRLAVGLLGLAGMLLAWQVAAAALNDPVLLPTVPKTGHDLVAYLHTPYPSASPTLAGHALISLRRIAIGFALGSVLGVTLGAAMASARPVRYLVDPVLGVLRPLPPLAFIPLFIVWMGIGETPKVVLIMTGVVPMVTVGTLTALDAVPAELLQASRSLGAGPLRTLLLVRLRAALPGVLTGMRLALGAAWTSIVAAEMIGATEGVGFITLQAGDYLQTSLVLSGIVLIAVLGLATDGVLRLALRRADPTTR